MVLRNLYLQNDEFIGALNNLLKRNISVKKCVELSATMEDLDKQKRILERARISIIGKHALKGDDDNFILAEDGMSPTFEDNEKNRLCVKEVNDLFQGTFEISLSSKITLSEDEKMSTSEYNLLKELIEV